MGVIQFEKFVQFQLETMKNADKRQGIMLAINVLHPRSRGSISLASADPLQRPLIDPNILGDTKDQHNMKIGTFSLYVCLSKKTSNVSC